MNTNSIYKCGWTAMIFLLASCSSGPFVQSKDVCDLKRHHQDDLYQVTVNDEAINKHYYLKDDAIEIANHLASREINKCAPRSFN
ncbi:MAG: hypothetical protein HYV97_02075 [Bdellovibrio sp.]|nr:hypothetical protein [Bdellovibrio sp.]